jgi:glycosyltransferase involved in cell wall biosynthesis
VYDYIIWRASVLKKRIINMLEIKKNQQNPYFSICIETHNRSATILRTLKSVTMQTFRDFECLIVDNRSTDNTLSIINQYFDSDEYKKNPFQYHIECNDEVINKLENWNKPLELAKGKFIVALEGDDQFLPLHLENAHNILSQNTSIGLLASSKTSRTRPWIGIKSAKEYFHYQYTMIDTAPPSEMIFIREHNGKAYRYNTTDYEYAPEIELYMQIAFDGYSAFYSDSQTVARDAENKPKPFKWIQMKDRFIFLKRWASYRDRISYKEFKNNWRRTCRICLSRYETNRVFGLYESEEIWSGLKKEIKYIEPYRYYMYGLLKFGHRLHHRFKTFGN